MNTVILVGTFLDSIFLTIFSLVLIQGIFKTKKFSFNKYWVSDFGMDTSTHKKKFNLTISLWGFLSLFLSLGFISLLEESKFTQFTAISLLVTCITTVIIGFLPQDKYRHWHNLTRTIIFIGAFGTALFSTLPLMNSFAFPKYLYLFNIGVLFSVCALAITFFVQKKIGAAKVWEWLVCLFAISWNAIIAITVIQSLLP